jgi:flagellar biosynthesis anti-sigma factor FlgM
MELFMRIDLTSSGLQRPENAGAQKAGQRGAAATGTNATAKTGAAGDSAQFSYDQTRLRSLSVQALAAPEIREATVSALAHAISTGDYRVDATKVAGAIVSASSGAQAS